MSLVVRQLKSNEADALECIMIELISSLPYYNEKAKRSEISKYTASELICKINQDPDSILVAVDQDKMVGFCLSRFDDMLIWIEWFGVVPGFRNKGVAKLLVKALEESAHTRNAHKVWCDCRTANIKSANLLTASGYIPLCTVKNHWYGQDFILWEKEIKTSIDHETKQ